MVKFGIQYNQLTCHFTPIAEFQREIIKFTNSKKYLLAEILLKFCRLKSEIVPHPKIFHIF